MGDPLSEPALPFHCPIRHGSRSGRKGGAFSKPEHNPSDKHGGKAADKSRKQSCSRPNYCRNGQRQTRSETVAYPTSNDLEEQIRIGKCGKNKSHLGVVEVKILLEYRSSCAHVHSIDVRDPIHETNQNQHLRGRRKTSCMPPGQFRRSAHRSSPFSRYLISCHEHRRRHLPSITGSTFAFAWTKDSSAAVTPPSL